MPQVEFTINPQTGELEVHIHGIRGRSCEDVQRELQRVLGTPTIDTPSLEYYLAPVESRPRTRPGR